MSEKNEVVFVPQNTLGESLHNQEIWFPKSNCELHEDGIDCPQWLFDKKVEDL